MYELNKPDWYTPQNVAEIEEFDKDDYGNTWYAAVFEGDAETYLWLAKNQPEEGKKYYGHVEKTKSGKRLRFRTDKVPEDGPKPEGVKKTLDYEPSTNARWSIGMAYRAFIQVTGTPEDNDGEFPFDAVYKHASELIKMFDKVKNYSDDSATVQQTATVKEEVTPSVEQERAPIHDKLQKGFSKSDIDEA